MTASSSGPVRTRAPLDDEVHLWTAAPAALDDEQRHAEALALLSGGERARRARFVFPEHQRLFVAAHALVRTALSRHAPVAAQAWRFDLGTHGRPEIAAGLASRLRFNLAHTRDLCVCAVTLDRDVGVDVEDTRRRAPLEIAARYFAPCEAAALSALPVEDRAERFFAYWTLKESYIKARGLGLALPLDGFSFTFAAADPRADAAATDGAGVEEAPRIAIDAALHDDAARWQLLRRRPTPHHAVALCVDVTGCAEGRVRLIERGDPWLRSDEDSDED